MAKRLELPRVWEVAVPHPDIFAGDLDPARFAISLNAVDRGEGAKDYVEPEQFFEKTFMTRSLKALLQGVLARLAGREAGVAIRHLQTPFGGGKTHTLTALYHLTKHPDVAYEKLPELFKELGLEEAPPPMAAAVLDGVALDPQGRRVKEGFEIRTLWGELAYRLGGEGLYHKIKASDERRTAPGAQALAELLQEARPALILLDEFVAYLVKARAIRVEDSNLAEQSLVFLQELATAVSGLPQVALVATLPQSSLEVAVTREEEAQRLLDRALHILGRQNLIETPVAEDEIFGVLRKRLFSEWGDEKTAEKVARAFRKYYSDNAGYFPENVQDKRYEERIIQAYPFHPELIDILQNRWGPHPRFQRTRGALRLLAFVIRDLWQKRPGSAYLIQPWTVDVSNRLLRGWVVEVPGSEYETVITSDVLEKGYELDRALKGEYYRERLATGTAIVALLYSISASPREVGATEEQIRLGVLRPKLNPAMVAEVLSRMRDQFWYLVYRDRKYRFHTKPNLNKMLQDFERSVEPEEIEQSMRAHLEDVLGRRQTRFRVVPNPSSSRDVEDRAEPTLVLTPWDLSDEEKWMVDILRHHGEGVRIHRNALVFVAPVSQLLSEAKVKARRLVAMENLRDSGQFRELEEDDRREVEGRLRSQREQLHQALRRAYVRIFRPQAPDGLVEVRAHRRELVKAATIAEYAWEVLKEEGQLLEKLSPEYLLEKVWTEREAGEIEFQRLWEAFWQRPGLPILASGRALLEAIAEGQRKGLFGAVRKKDETEKIQPVSPEEVEITEPERLTLVTRERVTQLRGKGPVVAKEREGVAEVPPRGPQMLRCTANLTMLYPLRELLNKLQGLSGKLVVEIEVEGEFPERTQHEIEQLLRDYKVSFELKDRSG
ncbi:MAG: Uncharacterized protein XD60_1536 [Acetothermia bacterium 64_32]|nr:MAG: Uncharacterized protein XD60_1536 [Acetothermia bacterium 64_32]HAF71482.1 hypothetical protein [Candidatus Acetothermia bacterium]